MKAEKSRRVKIQFRNRVIAGLIFIDIINMRQNNMIAKAFQLSHSLLTPTRSYNHHLYSRSEMSIFFSRNKQLLFMSSTTDVTTTDTLPSTHNHQNILEEQDPEIAKLIKKEDERQRIGLELIASENFASTAVRKVLGSCLTNKYSEGMGKFPRS